MSAVCYADIPARTRVALESIKDGDDDSDHVIRLPEYMPVCDVQSTGIAQRPYRTGNVVLPLSDNISATIMTA